MLIVDMSSSMINMKREARVRKVIKLLIKWDLMGIRETIVETVQN